MGDLTALTWWLAILTLLVAVQTTALAFLAIRSMGLFKRAESTLDGVDRALEPIAAGTRDLLGDLHALRETAQRAERSVSTAIDRVSITTETVKHAVVQRFWPVFGTLAAGRAIFRSFKSRRRPSRPGRDDREDQVADARFVAEGGPIHDAR